MSAAIFGAYASTTGEAPLDAVNERLLQSLAAKWHTATPVTVLEAMVILPEISTTTAHRRLKQLRADGWIELEMDGQDNRVKYVMPTLAALAYFAALGKLMKRAVEGGAA